MLHQSLSERRGLLLGILRVAKRISRIAERSQCPAAMDAHVQTSDA